MRFNLKRKKEKNNKDIIILKQEEREERIGEIEINNLNFYYQKNTIQEKKALDDINLKIEKNQIVGIIGHTGSGKSTLIQHLNALIYPQEGYVLVNGRDTRDKKNENLKCIRQEVGMVFQYPESQLFAETVRLDVSFGPKNLKISKEEVEERVKEAIESVGLNYEEYKDREPMDLSGGEKRRVAIAGVIAMRPQILILDEPTAGLDPKGKIEILDLIKNLKEKYIKTVIIISHDIDEIIEYADRLIVLANSKVIYNEKIEDLFKENKNLEEIGLDIPSTLKIQLDLEKKGYKIKNKAIRKEELINLLLGLKK